MPGILLMAALIIPVTAGLCLITLNSLSRTRNRYLWLLLAGLPLSLLVNRLVKAPVLAGIAQLAGLPLALRPSTPTWFILVIWMSAPVFEEAIKLLPLLIPGLRRYLQPGDALWAGLALGMSFGLGEAGYLAYTIAKAPQLSGLAWYLFTGFALERLMVTFAHGMMTALAVSGLAGRGGKALLGYLTAVGFHALINLGPILVPLKLIDLTTSSLATYIAIACLFVVFIRRANALRRAAGFPGRSQEILFER